MAIRSSHVIALGLALGLTGWLVSGQLGLGKPPAESAAASAETGSARLAAQLPSVRVQEMIAQPIEREIVVNGTTAPARAVTLRAETHGRVVELGPARGAAVRAGELVLRLDPEERQAMVDEALATLEMRQIEYEAGRKLGQKGFQADTKVAAAKANLEAAEALLQRARIELDRSAIRAPFDGVLEARPVEIGAYVKEGDTVAAVIEQDPFLVVADVAEADIGRIAVGMAGTARLITGERVEGLVRFVGSQAHAATRTFTVELQVANPKGRFAAGVSAELVIAYERALAHRLPASLLGLDDDGVLGVKAVDDEQRVVFYPVEVVRAEAQAVWLAGLPERVRLITVGQGFVRAGDRVRAIGEDSQVVPAPLVAGGPA